MRSLLALAIAGAVLLAGYSQSSVAQNNNDSNKLLPFTTDGCSMWIDGTPLQPNLWRHCCVTHDKAYWLGGPEQLRKDADNALHACVASAGGKAMGNYMYFFVSTGGSPYWLTPYRWGYGWSYLESGKVRGYKTPTSSEQQQIDTLLPLAEKIMAEDALRHPTAPASIDSKTQVSSQSERTSVKN